LEGESAVHQPDALIHPETNYREPHRGRFGDIGGRLSWTLGTSDGLLARAVRFLHGHGTLFRPTDAMAD
jgi:hypothetical protein